MDQPRNIGVTRVDASRGSPNTAPMADCYLFMAMPSPAERLALVEALRQALAVRGQRLAAPHAFDPANWHQSLSPKCEGPPALRTVLRQAGAAAAEQTPAFTLSFNRLRDAVSSSPASAIHWAFQVRGAAPGFAVLQQRLHEALRARGVAVPHGNRPHVTVSYRAPGPLVRLPRQHPEMGEVHWRVATVWLVRVRPAIPRYEAIDAWPLRPAPAGPEGQGELF
ncbi:hypothetical protein CCO03_05260 [Comamonas serinivorans]|uniref:2'-5' RNA ligase n=2 Tax=Comamonas serinivorans TaxID=1082851 RepID=A0A1Y0EKJ5_9BURK|nr:hypothetical protein CCO03_05260 [Comamonas serinivorans]